MDEYGNTILDCIYRVSQEEMSILWEVIISVILSKQKYMYMCPIPSDFRGRAIWMYRSLDLSPNIVLHSRRAASLYEASESVWSVRWPLRLLIVTLYECCAKFRTFAQLSNMGDMLYVYGFCDAKRCYSNLPQQISTISPVKVATVSKISIFF